MLPNLRKLTESVLATSLESAWGLPVELTSPDGITQTLSANDGETLVGQVLSSSLDSDPETGATLLTDKPVVTLRISSLDRVPLAGENWFIKMSMIPDPAATKEDFMMSADRPPFRNESIGFVKIYCQKVTQV